ncbi:MAG: 5-(carboxyamino)imidazole ribonucleotide synthase [Gloeomargarita sp. SKYBB_i_bin120]|nr:5-(carboxyamino)imidazole ribonucleotide synthase [Gloeomargarita sp. SKYB120]MDW8178659.1 5-(carboxyamino)imidazole ribonucleotide synthase [Gloeomargarita sp. SKYBB_i_bin120]
MNGTVGVLGGGQLAWMLAQAARDLHIPLWVQTPDPQAPAIPLSAGAVIAPLDDRSGLERLVQQCDVITFENEFINLELLAAIARPTTRFCPRLESLAPLLDKYRQRCYAQGLGIPVPEFWLLTPGEPAPTWPLVVKARRYGYDGLGTRIIHTPAQLEQLWREWPVTDVLAEAYVPFVQELAIVAARSLSGETAFYPVAHTYQANQVCRWVYAPAPVPDSVATAIRDYTHTLLTALDYHGVLATEWFYLADDRVLLNEVAPRTHNSGHYTIDACVTSQFQQHLRAITGQSLGSTTMTTDGALMINLLGYETAMCDYRQQREQLAQWGRVYWYGKTQARPGRKLGHVTLLNVAPTAISHWVEHVESVWSGGLPVLNLVQ